MRFAVECGRPELLRQLAVAVPQLGTQKYMSLIRAAGREKDIRVPSCSWRKWRPPTRMSEWRISELLFLDAFLAVRMLAHSDADLGVADLGSAVL